MGDAREIPSEYEAKHAVDINRAMGVKINGVDFWPIMPPDKIRLVRFRRWDIIALSILGVWVGVVIGQILRGGFTAWDVGIWIVAAAVNAGLWGFVFGVRQADSALKYTSYLLTISTHSTARLAEKVFSLPPPVQPHYPTYGPFVTPPGSEPPRPIHDPRRGEGFG